MPGLYRVGEGELDLAEAIRAFAGPDRGAISTFLGTARDHHAGRRVIRLEYEAYRPMAEATLRTIGAEIEQRFGTPHIAILHRLGVVGIGEASVINAVAAAHRKEAIEGCRFAIERLKAIAPIWKKEHYEHGSVWIEGASPDPTAT